MAQKLETAPISFGLVTIRVGVYSAVGEQDIHCNQLHGVCGSRKSNGDFIRRVMVTSSIRLIV